jgi:hypothetical protein
VPLDERRLADAHDFPGRRRLFIATLRSKAGPTAIIV